MANKSFLLQRGPQKVHRDLQSISSAELCYFSVVSV